METTGSVEKRWYEARQLQKLGLSEAAAKIGIPTDTLITVERSGDLSMLTDSQVAIAAGLYDVSVGFLEGK